MKGGPTLLPVTPHSWAPSSSRAPPLPGPTEYCGPAAYRGTAPNSFASLSPRLDADVLVIIQKTTLFLRNE